MVDRIVEFYNFDSDNESHVNGEELSELSDEFDDDLDAVEGNLSQKSSTRSQNSRENQQNPSSTLAIDDIPYDRDLKWINVPTTARPKAPQVLYNPNQNRLFKQVNEITKSNAQELRDLDEHYRKLDERKKFADQKFEKSFPDRKQKPYRFKEDRFSRGGGGNPGGRFNDNRSRDERQYMDSDMYQVDSFPNEIQQQQQPHFTQDRRFDGGRVGSGPRDLMGSPHDRYPGLHPLHHQHNHRNTSRRKQGGRYSTDPEYPSYGNATNNNKLAKNISANQQHHDDQVRHVRSDEMFPYPEQHPLRDYYDHSPHEFRQSNDFPPSPNDDYQNYAYQAPLGGYAAANHFRRTPPPPQQSPSNLANSTYSAPTATSSNISPGALNPFASEFVPSFMLR